MVYGDTLEDLLGYWIWEGSFWPELKVGIDFRVVRLLVLIKGVVLLSALQPL